MEVDRMSLIKNNIKVLLLVIVLLVFVWGFNNQQISTIAIGDFFTWLLKGLVAFLTKITQ
jgi:hypothetical protein